MTITKAEYKLFDRWINGTIREVSDRYDLYEDLYQHGWTSVLVARQSWDEDKGYALKSWIIQALRRDLVRFIEAEHRQETGRVDIDDLMYEDDVEELLDTEEPERIERLTEVSNLVGILSERELNVVELYYFEDLSEQEIAERLGVSRSMVQKIHRRALEKMKGQAGVSET